MLVNNLKDIEDEIGIVINCAGLTEHGYFMELNPYSFLDASNVNFYSMYAINKKLIPRLRERAHKSAIINVSSCTGRFNSFYLGVYPTLKRMADIYSRTLSLENKGKIDIISSCPFGVTTKMINNKKGPMIITPEDCVKSTLGDLGRSDITYTGFKHKVMAIIFENSS